MATPRLELTSCDCSHNNTTVVTLDMAVRTDTVQMIGSEQNDLKSNGDSTEDVYSNKSVSTVSSGKLNIKQINYHRRHFGVLF